MCPYAREGIGEIEQVESGWDLDLITLTDECDHGVFANVF